MRKRSSFGPEADDLAAVAIKWRSDDRGFRCSRAVTDVTFVMD